MAESTIERWDGKDRWVRYVYRKKAQVESVQIDPDVSGDHGPRLPEQQPCHGSAARRGAQARNLLDFFTQFLAQMMSWLA